MRGKFFAVKTFSSENDMLNFINDSESKQPISVVIEGYTYKLYYLW